MKQSLQLRLGQSLTMTPQLQQAIRLLQLSSLELSAEVQEALETNPMLEAADDNNNPDVSGERTESSAPEVSDSEVPDQEIRDQDRSNEKSGADAADDLQALGSEVQMGDIPNELPVDSVWEDTYDIPYSSGTYSGGEDTRMLESQGKASESLREHLLWQMEMTPFSEMDKTVATVIIDSIDEHGYLSCTLEDVLQSVGLGEQLELDEVAAVLHRIQRFDPVGVGACNLQECMLIQLEHYDPDTPWLAEAKKLVTEHLTLLGNRDYTQLMRSMKLSQAELFQVVTLIQTLNPRPGGVVTDKEAEYVIPDVTVKKHNGVWQVELNSESLPHVRINNQYAGLVRRANNSAENTYLKNHLQEARWFIKSLKSRNETLLRVASSIVKHQRGFLEHGEVAMKALVLHDVAEALELHESTVSRVTTQKYMMTPRGVFELKYFFSSHVSTASGGECSATAIRALIKKLIAAEDPGKPLSDSKIANILSDQGINVARRTVAKYREAMRIQPSNERKRLT